MWDQSAGGTGGDPGASGKLSPVQQFAERRSVSNRGSGQAMNSLFRPRRTSPGRRRPSWECLESRCVLSAIIPVDNITTESPLAVQGLSIEPFSQLGFNSVNLQQQVSDPGELALLSDPRQPTQALVLTFNQAFPGGFIASDPLGSDVQLTDAQNNPVIDSWADPPPELVLDPNADATMQLIVPLVEGKAQDQWQPVPLQPATYQVSLMAGSTLSFLLPGGNSPAGMTANQNLAQFSVLGQGITLANAVNLNTIGPSTQVVSGRLDPNNYQSAVDLYEFTLGPGSLWQVSLEVKAHGIGSPLLPALSVFDAQGHVLDVSNGGMGSFDNANDPFLQLGLHPGTYFVGVSGEGNLPNQPGGYDPVAGAPGTIGVKQSGGPFQLDLLATPVVKSTSVVNFSLQYEDSLSSSPTGLTVTFSGPVNTDYTVDQLVQSLQVIDSQGRAWALTAPVFDPSTNQLSFLFSQALPAGSYSLIEPAQGGLTDLAGQPVVGPAGSPSDLLASWTVAPTAATPPAGPGMAENLGVIWPGPVNVSWRATTIQQTTQLNPGQDLTYRFVVICPGIYTFQSQIEPTVGATGNAQQLANQVWNLSPGVYFLNLPSPGPQPVRVHWAFRPISLDYEKVLDNGVGQAAAFNPSAVGLQASVGDLSSASPISVPASTSTPSTPSAPSPSPDTANGSAAEETTTGAAMNSTAITVTASPIPAGLLVSLNTGVMGLPSPTAQHVAVVGPTAEGASTALADNAAGLLPGIRYRSVPDPEDRLGAGDPPVGPDATAAGPVVASEAVLPAPEGANSRGGRDRADAQALARADWLVRLAARLGDTLAPALPEESPLPATTAEPTAVTAQTDAPAIPPSDADGSVRGNPRVSVAHADLGAPVSLVLAIACTYRLRRPLRKWWRRQDQAAPSAPELPRFPGRGPHWGPLHPTPSRCSRKVCVPS